MHTRLTTGAIVAAAFCALTLTVAGPAAAVDESQLRPELLAKRCFTDVDPSFSNINWQSEIHIKSDADVQTLRAALIRQFFPQGFPSGSPNVTMAPATTDKADPNASGLYGIFMGDHNSGLKAEYRLTVVLPNGLRSIVFLWVPKSSNNRLFMAHDGHANNSYYPDGRVKVPAMVNPTNYVTANTLLNKGFTVVWFQMPLYGDNMIASHPAPPYPSNCMTLQCDRHTALFQAYATSATSPYFYYLDPVIATLNLVLSQGSYQDVTMMGASGGGWTTLVSAAIDPRITTSVAVAGSLPLQLRTGECGRASLGDGEQQGHPGLLYSKISFLDLYIMASDGPGRQHIQVNNQYDTCCFFGVTHKSYSDMLESYISQHNLGRYKYVLDTKFVGHGYDSKTTPPAANNTLNEIVLPAIMGGS